MSSQKPQKWCKWPAKKNSSRRDDPRNEQGIIPALTNGDGSEHNPPRVNCPSGYAHRRSDSDGAILCSFEFGFGLGEQSANTKTETDLHSGSRSEDWRDVNANTDGVTGEVLNRCCAIWVSMVLSTAPVPPSSPKEKRTSLVVSNREPKLSVGTCLAYSS